MFGIGVGEPFSPYESDTGQAVSHDLNGNLMTVAGNLKPEYANQPVSPQSEGVLDAGFVPRPPDPALGGKAGPGHRLGWTTGLRTSRAFRRRFGDDSMVIDVQNQVHPVEGPVGYSTRGDRLVYGADLLANGDGAPTNAQVAESFTTDYAASVLAAQGVNPNYG